MQRKAYAGCRGRKLRVLTERTGVVRGNLARRHVDAAMANVPCIPVRVNVVTRFYFNERGNSQRCWRRSVATISDRHSQRIDQNPVDCDQLILPRGFDASTPQSNQGAVGHRESFVELQLPCSGTANSGTANGVAAQWQHAVLTFRPLSVRPHRNHRSGRRDGERQESRYHNAKQSSFFRRELRLHDETADSLSR